MMNYETFETTMKELFEDVIGADINIASVRTRKNNNTLYRGITLKAPGKNIAPTLYLEDAYQAYRSGIPISDIFKKLYHIYESRPLPRTDINEFLDFENVKEKIVYKLVNYEQNTDLLNEIPYISYLDLAIVFYLLLDVSDNSISSMMIYNDHLSIWGVDTATLYSYAKENTPKLLPASIQSMTDVVGKIDAELIPDDFDIEMFILTNTYYNLGAGCILYDNILRTLGSCLHENFYILPSSTHECIIIPQSKAGSNMEMREMIREVNQAVLDPRDVLSDHPYYYDLLKETIEIAA